MYKMSRQPRKVFGFTGPVAVDISDEETLNLLPKLSDEEIIEKTLSEEDKIWLGVNLKSCRKDVLIVVIIVTVIALIISILAATGVI